SRRRHTRLVSDWSSDVCSSDLSAVPFALPSSFPLTALSPSVLRPPSSLACEVSLPLHRAVLRPPPPVFRPPTSISYLQRPAKAVGANDCARLLIPRHRSPTHRGTASLPAQCRPARHL